MITIQKLGLDGHFCSWFLRRNSLTVRHLHPLGCVDPQSTQSWPKRLYSKRPGVLKYGVLVLSVSILGIAIMVLGTWTPKISTILPESYPKGPRYSSIG